MNITRLLSIPMPRQLDHSKPVEQAKKVFEQPKKIFEDVFEHSPLHRLFGHKKPKNEDGGQILSRLMKKANDKTNDVDGKKTLDVAEVDDLIARLKKTKDVNLHQPLAGWQKHHALKALDKKIAAGKIEVTPEARAKLVAAEAEMFPKTKAEKKLDFAGPAATAPAL